MHEEPQQSALVSEPSIDTFDTWINKPYIPENIKQQLKTANLLFIPVEKIRNHEGPVFPTETERLYKYVKQNAKDGLAPAICIAKDDYEEYTFHSVMLILGFFIALNIITPVFVNLLSDYIKERAKEMREENLMIRFQITVVEGTRSTHYYYEGKAEEFSKHIFPHIGTASPQPHSPPTPKSIDFKA